MKFKLRFPLSVGLVAFLAIPGVLSAHGGQPSARYTVTDLGTLGGDYSFAYSVNSSDVVLGGAATPNQTDFFSQTAFLWAGGQPINLRTLGGSDCPDCSSEGAAASANGQAVILSEAAGTDPNGEDFCGFGTHHPCLAAVWNSGSLTPLPTLAGGNNSQAYWVNNQGDIIGFSETGVFDSSCELPFQVLRFEAVVWTGGGTMQRLHPYNGDTVSFGFGINDHGQAVGVSGLCSNTSIPPNYQPAGTHAVLWQQNGSVLNLGSLAPDALSNVATSINNLSYVVGTSALSDGTVHAFLWTPKTGKPQDLGTFPSGSVVTVTPCCHTINDRGEIVGFSIDATGNMRALLWQSGGPIDLNSLLPADSPWYLLDALSINDAGQIAGFGINGNGELHAYLATPIGNTVAPLARGATKARVLPRNMRLTLQRRIHF